MSETNKVPWNVCPSCDDLVDADDVFDGSEVKCGCGQLSVATNFEGGAWALVPAEGGTT